MNNKNKTPQATNQQIVMRWWLRFNVIIGWPFVLICDIVIAVFYTRAWVMQRNKSKSRLNEIWSRY